MIDPIRADVIREALKKAYPTPEWYLSFEVGNSTGAACRRHADAIAINAYPSKGFETRGFEIKVSKQDLNSELKNGLKSDEIARFCDYWFLVVPKGLTDGITLPPTWGVIEYNNGALRQKIGATALDNDPITPGFLCAMLRGRERLLYDNARKISSDTMEQIKRDSASRQGNAVETLKQLHDKLEEIKAATGIALDQWTPTKSIIDRLNAAQQIDIITRNIRYMQRAADGLLKNAQEVKNAAEAIYVESQGGD